MFHAISGHYNRFTMGLVMETITIYALQYSDDPFCAPYLKTIAISKEDAKAKIERLNEEDSLSYSKDDVVITVYEINLTTGEVFENGNIKLEDL